MLQYICIQLKTKYDRPETKDQAEVSEVCGMSKLETVFQLKVWQKTLPV